MYGGNSHQPSLAGQVTDAKEITINAPSREAVVVGKEEGKSAWVGEWGLGLAQRHPRLEAGGWPQSLRPPLIPCSDFLPSLRPHEGRYDALFVPWHPGFNARHTPDSSSIHVDHLSHPNLGCTWEANQRGQTLSGQLQGGSGVSRPMAILEDRGGSGCIHVQAENFGGRHSRGLLGGLQGLDGAEGGPRLRVEQQPQKQFLFIDITRLLGQVPVPGKGGGAG